MGDFREKTGRISDCLLPRILNTVPVSREFTVIDLFKLEEFVPWNRRPLFRIAWYFWASIKCSGIVSLVFSEDILRELPQRVTNIFSKCRYKHCNFTLCPSSTAAPISKPRQFLEPLEVCKQMSYPFLTTSRRNFWKIICEFQTAGYLVLWKSYPAAGYVDTAYDKTVSHNEETKSHNNKTTSCHGETTSHNHKTTSRNHETT